MEFLKKNKTCNHSSVMPDVDFAYCPDCGELVENQWYIIRCACCGVKLKGILKNGQIIPEKHFCHNCGTENFIIERIDKINFIDISYAVLVKSVVPYNEYSHIQSWVDFKTSGYRQQLLPQSR